MASQHVNISILRARAKKARIARRDSSMPFLIVVVSNPLVAAMVDSSTSSYLPLASKTSLPLIGSRLQQYPLSFASVLNEIPH